MHYVISFESDAFDLQAEDPNPINPIPGQSVGRWLCPLLAADGVAVDADDIDAEDWGWYCYATLEGRAYLVGFVALTDEEQADASPELVVQIEKRRTLMEKLTGKARMEPDDPLLAMVRRHVEAIGDVRNVEISHVG